MSLLKNFKKATFKVWQPDFLKQRLEERQRLQEIKSLLALIPEGAFLLELAHKKRFKISFNEDKKLKNLLDEGSGTTVATISHRAKKIRLMETSDSNIDCAVSLAHELRHMWQHHVVPEIDKWKAHMSPRALIALTRILEGDAHAFHVYIANELHKKTGLASLSFIPNMPEGTDGWRGVFLVFQDPKRSADYDRDSMKGGYFSHAFNTQMLADLKGLGDILVAGIDKNSPRYFGNHSQATIVKTVLKYSSVPAFD